MQSKYIKTNPGMGIRNDEVWRPKTDLTLPVVSTTLRPIDREDSNVEVERNEVVISPDMSSVHKVLGKPHSKGGTPVFLKGGSFVFSKDNSLHINKKEQELFGLKTTNSNKKSDNTPAKVLERNVDMKHHNQMSAILQDKKNRDLTARNTAQVMVAKNQEKFGQIAFIQEAKKQFRDGVPEISQGTQPIYSDDTKEGITTEDQYMKHGGHIQFMEKAGPVKKKRSPQYNMYTPEQQKQLDNGELAAPPYSGDITNPFGVQHSNGLTYGQIGQNKLSPFKDFNWWLYGHNPNATPAQYQSGYTNNIDPAYSGYGFNNTDGTRLNDIDGKLGNYTATRPLSYGNMSQRDLNLLQSIDAARPYQYRGRSMYQVADEPTLFNPTSGTEPMSAPTSAPNLSIPRPTGVSNPVPMMSGTPNQFNNPGGVYTNQKVGFNNGQLADLAGTALLNGMRKNIYPRRSQDSFVPVELEKVNPNQALQQNTNNWLQAARISAMTGSTPAQTALGMNAAIQGISNANQIRSQYDTQNVEIGNQQNLYNNQGLNNVRARNVQNNANYNQQVDTTIGRANEEKINGLSDILNKGLGYYGQNLQMQNALNAQQQYPVLNPDGSPKKDAYGRQVYNTPYSYRNGNYQFNSVNGFNMVQGQRQGIFDQQIKALQTAIDSTTDEKSKALMWNNMVRLITSKQTPYQNKYGGSILRNKKK